MRFRHVVANSIAALSGAVVISALPQDASSLSAPAQMPFLDPSSTSNVFFQSIFSWLHSSSSSILPGVSLPWPGSHGFVGDAAYASLGKPDYTDKSIWEVIQIDEHFTDFKRVLKYSGPKTRKLLDDKEKKLTFLAPVNWHRRDHDKKIFESDDASNFDESHLSKLEQQIQAIEEDEQYMTFKDDKEREHRRKVIAYLIDATIEYHVIDSEEPLKAWDVAQNSSVATLLHIGDGPARKYLGNLLDGNAFRLRVGKSLLPRPSAYFNFYSRLVYPDLKVASGWVHAVSLPLLIPASISQKLFLSQPYLAGTTSALQKTHQIDFLRYPINRTAIHQKDDDLLGVRTYEPSILLPEARFDAMSDDRLHHNLTRVYPAQVDVTYFAQSNSAWARLPPVLRLYLMSPFGYRLLPLVLALQSIPKTIFYADFVYSHQGHGSANLLGEKREEISATQLLSSPEWLWGPTSEDPSIPVGTASVSRYTFNTACPKIHFNHTHEDYESDKVEFETVDISVYRYHVLPGGRGPLQTRINVQGVPVLFQDIAAGNGALHVLNGFVKPKDHPHKGIWSHVAQEAEKFGYGKVTLEEMDF